MSIKKVIFKYLFKEDYNPIYVNGAQGGINPQGEIIINFYLERNALPISQTYGIEDVNIGFQELESKPSDLNNSFVRVIANGVILNYQTAKEIHKWLGNHIKTLEDLSTHNKLI